MSAARSTNPPITSQNRTATTRRAPDPRRRSRDLVSMSAPRSSLRVSERVDLASTTCGHERLQHLGIAGLRGASCCRPPCPGACACAFSVPHMAREEWIARWTPGNGPLLAVDLLGRLAPAAWLRRGMPHKSRLTLAHFTTAFCRAYAPADRRSTTWPLPSLCLPTTSRWLGGSVRRPERRCVCAEREGVSSGRSRVGWKQAVRPVVL